MAMVNRSAILLIPKKPYADWANAIDDDGPRFTISEGNDDLTVFLGPELYGTDEIDAWVNQNFDFFFEHWLHGWRTDPATWPKRRTAKMLRLWLDEFKRIWRYHDPLTDVQLTLADTTTSVRRVGCYHGGDPLYVLEGRPRCIRGPAAHLDTHIPGRR